MYLLFAEDQARRGKLMYMKDLDELEKHRSVQDKIYASDFDRFADIIHNHFVP
jgi:hypothetical protein